MPKATLSILGLYNFDNTIFDNFALPAQMNNEKETLIDNLLMECAEFEILYADPDFMKQAIKAWSRSMVSIWEKLYATTQFNYDPIANYDRNETWTDTDSRKIQNDRTPNLTNTTTYGKTDTLTHNTTDTLTHGHVITDAENSYENAGFVDARKETNSGNDATAKTGTETTVGSGTDSLKTTGTDSNVEQHSGNIVHTGRAYGNIGVTTTQQMIEQERESVLFNMFHVIINDFKMRFCLLIY